ncbi:MAG: Fe-S protein assembly chaperone HscA [Pseudomonadota bacterium]|nr:Fe-S protein assembly chaperone HscA [Porticoccaceae bacterium]MCH2559601.1 Fe-S protein assembly chaperone HscA [Pseudomonadales bacterium]MEC7636362.1 Fe-S protein assembly chaperone HscA [Pseudomonadota bacterium]|tara:strand:- start:1059 stop:2945 length:1887 start_codon:yes stop_codon:yes gene_type:complete
MVLMQISEPGLSSESAISKKLALGIDLGTTNSLIAFKNGKKVSLIGDENGDALIPSVVHFPENGSVIVGENAKNKLNIDPLNTVSSVKRLIGRGKKDLLNKSNFFPYKFDLSDDRFLKVETRKGIFSPVEISSEILKFLNKRALEFLKRDIDGVVITVPAYFDEAQRQATKDSATLAGMKVLRLLNEPTAAAIAYGLDLQEEGTVAVYDLGGGTFDISILRLVKGVFEVLATGGDASLGGDDFDYAIVNWMIQSLKLNVDGNVKMESELLLAARAAKENLSTSNQKRSVVINFYENQLVLSRDQYEDLTQDLVKKTIRACKQTLRDASLKIDEIDNVLLVGGSSRNFNVQTEVKKLFKIQPRCDLDPDKVVAIGAAYQADILIGNRNDENPLLLDVNPLSLGLETMGGLVEKIIPRNSTIPISKVQEFTTFKDGQTAMKLHIVQGERELVTDCRSLASFEVRDIPPMVAGAAKISVLFQVDADGLLSVEATELSSGEKTSVVVKPSFGLTESEITGMLRDSFDKAEDDHKHRLLAESQVEADRIIYDLQSALQLDAKNVLTTEEIENLQLQIENLQKVREDSEDRDLLIMLTEKLMQSSESFAEKRMNFSIKKALSGKTLTQVEDEIN